jgi:hypothetical protein
MIDTKGGSLRNLDDHGGIGANIGDIRQIAAMLDAHAPDSEAAITTRRVLATFHQLDRLVADVCDLWGAVAYQLENGWSEREAVEEAIRNRPGAAVASPSVDPDDIPRHAAHEDLGALRRYVRDGETP